MIPRIYADANDMTEGGCFMLHVAGSFKDIERYREQLLPGTRAVFNVQDEFEVEGVLKYDEENKMWLGCPDLEDQTRPMRFAPNHRPRADAGWRIRFAFPHPWPRAAQADRSAINSTLYGED